MDESVLSAESRAILKRLAEKEGVEYVAGSLRELELIEELFKPRTGEVAVYLIADGWEEIERNWGGEDEEEMVRVDGVGGRYHVSTKARREPRSSGPGSTRCRSLRAWAAEQRLRMMGGVAEGAALEFLRRYYFRPMVWDGQLVKRLYYNRESRKVYIRLGGVGSVQ